MVITIGPEWTGSIPLYKYKEMRLSGAKGFGFFSRFGLK